MHEELRAARGMIHRKPEEGMTMNEAKLHEFMGRS